MHSSEITLEWKNLCYSVERNVFKFSKLKRLKESVNVLKNVRGSVHSGQLVAIIGPSGAGKTSLLAAISQRLRGDVSGSLLLNGSPVSRSDMVKRSSFIPQFDITSDFLTVSELMHFVFQLRNCMAIDSMHVHIENVLRKLGIHKTMHSRISVISGGERKILNLATELLTDPSFVFCDEPTTGLDSFNALSVLTSLQLLVSDSSRNGHKDAINHMPFCNKVVLCSIHQPSSAVFACFSHVILMQGGQIYFQGTVDQAEDALSRMGFPCQPSFNRADFFIKTLIDNSASSSFAEDLGDMHLKQEQRDATEDLITQQNWQQIKTINIIKNVSWCYQVVILCQRFSLESRRSLNEFFYRLLTFGLTAICIGLVYAAADSSSPRSTQDISGFVFNLTAQVIFATAYNIVFYYPSRLPILRREIGERMYSLSAYYVANILCVIPKSAIECFGFLAIVYPFVKFINGVWMFFVIGTTLTIISIPATAYGLMLSGMFESSIVATSMAPPFDVLFVLMGGIYIKLKTLWFLRYLSMFFYANESLSILIWKDISASNCSSNATDICTEIAADVLESLSYGSTYTTVVFDYAGLLGCALLMNMIGFIGVRMMVNRTGYY